MTTAPCCPTPSLQQRKERHDEQQRYSLQARVFHPFGKHRGTATDELGYRAVSELMATAGVDPVWWTSASADRCTVAPCSHSG